MNLDLIATAVLVVGAGACLGLGLGFYAVALLWRVLR